jgi:hypothetical protein
MTIERAEVLDYVEFGKRVVQWTLDANSRPQNLAAMKLALRDIVLIPDRMKTLRYVEVSLDELVIRLPNQEMIRESLAAFGKAGGDAYPTPLFYRNLLASGGGMSKFDALHSRIADYTIAQCR